MNRFLEFIRRGWWAVLLVLCGIGILANFDPQETLWYPKCVLHAWTGFHCPGCGATRAAHALVHGQLVTALRMNPLFVVALPFLTVWLCGQLAPERREVTISPRISWLIVVLLMGFFVARNVPTPTASYLAPPNGQDASNVEESAGQFVE